MSGAEITKLNPGDTKVVLGTSGILPTKFLIHGEVIPEQSAEGDNTLAIKVEKGANGQEVSLVVPDVTAEKPTVEIIDQSRSENNVALGGIRVGLEFIAEVYNIHGAEIDGQSNVGREELPEVIPVLLPLKSAA
jgi:hypothetical protein